VTFARWAVVVESWKRKWCPERDLNPQGVACDV